MDWNRPYLLDIIKNPDFEQWGCFGEKHMAVLTAYAKGDDVALNAAIDELAKENPYERQDWKRTIGIFIACSNNHLLPYPIKIVDCVRPKKYKALPPSVSCQ